MSPRAATPLGQPLTGAPPQEALAARLADAMRERLARAEREWLRGRLGAAAAASASASAWLRSYAATIVGNVRLSVTNVHLRYEHPDPAPPPGVQPRPLAAGVTLAALRAITVDASGAETFATAGALERVRKARVPLARFATCFGRPICASY